jgi:hypothetical protein
MTGIDTISCAVLLPMVSIVEENLWVLVVEEILMGGCWFL